MAIVSCPKCGAAAPDGARFCEADGTPLAVPLQASAPSAVRCACGAGPEARDSEGFCTACGRAWPTTERAHKEVSLSERIAGVTDRGRRHPQNEDDFVLAREQVEDETALVLVVCDGVSSAECADEASAAACAAACDGIGQGLRAGRTDADALLREAVAAANRAVCALPFPPSSPKDPPETTLVAALACAGTVSVAWVGDSRAYRIWADDMGQWMVAPLTHDHSWVNEAVDAGQLSRAQAQHSPQAHAITRCLGLDGEASEPSLAAFPLGPADGLLLCSDGFWNYAQNEQEISRLLSALPAGTDALSACRALTEYALTCGGRDNITVIIAWPPIEKETERRHA